MKKKPAPANGVKRLHRGRNRHRCRRHHTRHDLHGFGRDGGAHVATKSEKSTRVEDYTMKEAVAVARIVGLVAIAAPMVALETANAVPIAGWAVKGTIAGGVIKTLGEAIIARYEKMEREGTDISIADMPPVLESPAHAPDALHQHAEPTACHAAKITGDQWPHR